MTEFQLSKPFWPARGWWLALLLILIVAGGLRYTGYNFSLPYLDHVDEPVYNIAGRMMIDFGSAKPMGMHGYPPGIVTLNYVLLRLFHNPPEPPGVVIVYVRLISITFSLGVVMLIALLGYRVATPLAGLLAAGMWTLTPVIVDHSRFATADNFVTFFALLALFLMLSGTQYNRNPWTTYAVVASMFAIVFKYQAVFFLPLIVAGPLWRLRDSYRDKTQARAILKNLAVNLFWLALFFLWLVLIFPVTEANKAPDWSASEDRLTIPDWSIVRINVQRLVDPLRDDLLWTLGGAGLLLLLWPRFRRRSDLFGLGVLLAGAGLWCVGVSFFGAQFFRQFISVGALAVILVGVGLAGWAVALEALIKRLDGQGKIHQRARLSAAVVGLLVLIGFVPQIKASLDNVHNHTLHDRRNDLARYMDYSLAPGPYISPEENHKTFNGPWGGYNGQHEFPLAEMAFLDERPLADWQAEGVRYAIMPHWLVEAMSATPQGQEEYLDHMLKLKTYPPSDQYRGPDMIVFRLEPIQHPVERPALGPIRLVGYDIDQTELAPGETITFSLYWQAETGTAVDYVVYNHLALPDSRDIVAQIDGPPYVDTRRGTSDWTDPGEVMVSQPFTLAVGADVTPGAYRLITGFYRRDTFERLITPDGADFVLVTNIQVIERSLEQ